MPRHNPPPQLLSNEELTHLARLGIQANDLSLRTMRGICARLDAIERHNDALEARLRRLEATPRRWE